MITRRKIYTTDNELHLVMGNLFRKHTDLSCRIPNFEEAFAHFIGVKHAIAVSSGRVGMELILRSLKLDKGDEVIIPAYTLKDLIGIIRSLGLTVIPADIDSKTFNIDPNLIAERITKRTKVILATHLFGTSCQIDKILETARSKSIFVIEDCAHSAGSEFMGRKTGSFGGAAFFSFETIKPVNTYGGGMVVTDDEKLAGDIRKTVADYGVQTSLPFKKIIMAFFEDRFLPTPLSFFALYLLASRHWSEKVFRFYRATQKLSASNKPFTDLQAFLGLEKLKTLQKRIASRQAQALLLKSLLNSNIVPQQAGEGMSPNYYFFVALLPFDVWDARRSLLMHGVDAGIGSEITDDCGSILGLTDCPNAKRVFEHAIQLPLHEGMSESNIRYLAAVLGRLFK